MISVCIATYNGEQHIKEQLNSILLQLGEDDEIIVSDDNSSDQTLKIISGYNDNRIKIFNNPDKGVGKNFENAIQQSIGDYIFLADQDDIWATEKVEKVLHFFNEGYDLVLSDAKVFETDIDHIVHKSFFEFNNSKNGFFNNLLRNSFMGCCMAFKSTVKDKAMPFPEHLPMHDNWIGLIAIKCFKVKYLKEPLIYYRKHEGNFSATAKGVSNNSLLKKIKFRYTLISALIQRLIFSKNN